MPASSPSAWRNSSKIASCWSAAMPGPGVPDGDAEDRVGRAARLDRDLALAGELQGVAEQVDEDLADPLAVEDDLAGRAARPAS